MKTAIIPARGGSKRIPRKNIRLFNGKPMLAWSVEAALQSGVFDRVIVSTDDHEIAEVARLAGAEVPFIRPAELADDYTGTGAVIVHAIDWLRQQQQPPALVGCIYATAPLLLPTDLQQAASALEANPALKFVFSGCRFSFPIQRALYRNAQGQIEPVQPDAIPKRSQDLPETFHDAGQFYLGQADDWCNGSPMFAPHSFLQELPQHRVQDIDTEADWLRAELLQTLLLQPPRSA
jgi:N-acylneuraminate cytidylyltransferase